MMTNDIEFYSFHRAQRSIRRADVVLLLIDATERVSEPDKKLAQYVAEQYKPVVLVVNKWDLAKQILLEQKRAGAKTVDDRELMKQYREYLDAELRHLSYAPISFTTASEGRNVQAVLDTAQHLFNQARVRISTSRLNQAIRAILEERSPSTPVGNRPKIYYATQVETTPPTIVLVVNNPAMIDETYQRYMTNRLRKVLPYREVPIRLVLRPRAQRGDKKGLDEGAAGQAVRRPGKRAAETKPQPKRVARKGPPRGTRPRGK
jgi:GTP-binding protein